jgi:hypothetical protein
MAGGDAMLFMPMPMPGRELCWPNVGLPIPGFSGLMAGNDELSDENELLDAAALCP